MFLLVMAHLGCPGQSPERRKMVVVLVASEPNLQDVVTQAGEIVIKGPMGFFL